MHKYDQHRADFKKLLYFSVYESWDYWEDSLILVTKLEITARQFIDYRADVVFRSNECQKK